MAALETEPVAQCMNSTALRDLRRRIAAQQEVVRVGRQLELVHSMRVVVVGLVGWEEEEEEPSFLSPPSQTVVLQVRLRQMVQPRRHPAPHRLMLMTY